MRFGSQSSPSFHRVASVAVVASKCGGGSLLANFKIQNLAAGSGQITNFEFCGVGSQSSPSSRRVGRRCRVEARRKKPTCKNSEIRNLVADAAKFRILNFAASGLNHRRRRIASRRVASVAVVASKHGGGSLFAKFKIQNLAADAAKV